MSLAKAAYFTFLYSSSILRHENEYRGEIREPLAENKVRKSGSQRFIGEILCPFQEQRQAHLAGLGHRRIERCRATLARQDQSGQGRANFARLWKRSPHHIRGCC